MASRRTEIRADRFESKRKNPIELGDDSNLEPNLKPIKIGGKNSILELSDDELKVRGSIDASAITVDGASVGGATQLNELSDVAYSSGDLTISSLDTIVASGTLRLKLGDGDQAAFNLHSDDAGASQSSHLFGMELGNYSSMRLNERGGSSNSDYFDIQVNEHGATIVSTVDAASTNADLTFDVDGAIKLDAASYTGSDGIEFLANGTEIGNITGHHNATYFTLYENIGASVDDYMSLYVKEHGETYLLTSDAASNAANLRLHVDGDIKLNPHGGLNVTIYNDAGYNDVKHDFKGASHYLAEQADALVDDAGFGQIWIHDDTTNTLYFTNDAGDDIQITDGSELHQKYVYETKFIGYNASGTTVYLPMNGYIIERTSTASNNEFISFVAPYNGTIEKFAFRSEIAQDGNFRIILAESSDGTEIPGSTSFRKDATYTIADDTYQELALTSPGTGSSNAPMTKGKIYLIELTTPSLSSDTNVTIVFK